MKVLKSYKFRIKNPGELIFARLESTLNLCRELYNGGLQERRDAWKLNGESINYFDQANQLKEIKELRPDVKMSTVKSYKMFSNDWTRLLSHFFKESSEISKLDSHALREKIDMIRFVFLNLGSIFLEPN